MGKGGKVNRRLFLFALLSGMQAARAEGDRERRRGNTFKCENLDALRAKLGTPADTAIVAGYLSPGDGGGGRFSWDPVAVVPDNGGTKIAGPAKIGRWVREPGTVIPEWFGASGNGKTDDTNALTAMLEAERNVTLSPDKTYAVSSIVCAAETIILGSGATLLQLPQPSGMGRPIIRFMGGNIQISNVHFDGQRSLQPRDGFSDSFDTGRIGTGRAFRAGILADGVQRPIRGIRISGCAFREMYGACIALREVADVLVEKNRVTTTNFELLHVTGARISSNIRVTDNVCQKIGTGDPIVQANGMVLSNVQDVIFSRNAFGSVERNALKLEQTCRNVMVQANSLERNSSDNFAFVQVQSLGTNHAENITITGNRAANVCAGFAFNTARLSKVLVEGNEIVRTTGPSMGDGIQLANGDMHDITIRGNVLRGIHRYGVYLGQSMRESRISEVSITDNEISDNAQRPDSGAAILVGVFGGNDIPLVENVRITGNRLGFGVSEAKGAGCIVLRRKGEGDARVTRLVIADNKFSSDCPVIRRVVVSPGFVARDAEISN